MKKGIVFMMSMAMTLLFSGCGCSQNSTPTTIGNNDSQGHYEDNTVEPRANKVQEGEGNIGDFKVEIADAKITKSIDGKDAIVVSYKLTNNSNEIVTFDGEFSAEVCQEVKGKSVILPQASLTDQSEDKENMLRKVKPGETVVYKEGHRLVNLEDPVSSWVTERPETLGEDQIYKEAVTKTFSLQELLK